MIPSRRRRSGRPAPELIVNGTFVDASGWTTGTDGGSSTVTISGGTLNLTGDNTNFARGDQSIPTEVGKLYVVTFTVGGAGIATTYLNIGTASGGAEIGQNTHAAAGTYSYSFVAATTTTWFRFTKSTALTTTIDNVSCREAAASGPELVTNGTFDSATTGWTDNSTTSTATGGRLRVTPSLGGGSTSFALTVVVGRTYRINYDQFLGTGTPGLCVGTAPTGGSSANLLSIDVTSGSRTRYFTATATTVYINARLNDNSTGVYAEWDNISAQEVTARAMIG